MLFCVALWIVRCYFLVRSAWSLSFPSVFCLVAVVSCCTLDGHCFFLVPSGWSLLFRGAFTSNTCHTQANTKQSNNTAPNKPKYCAQAHLPKCYECPPQKSGGHSLHHHRPCTDLLLHVTEKGIHTLLPALHSCGSVSTIPHQRGDPIGNLQTSSGKGTLVRGENPRSRTIWQGLA